MPYCCVKITPVENSSQIYGFSQCLTYKTDDSPENEGKPKQKQHWCKLTLWEDLGLACSVARIVCTTHLSGDHAHYQGDDDSLQHMCTYVYTCTTIQQWTMGLVHIHQQWCAEKILFICIYKRSISTRERWLYYSAVLLWVGSRRIMTKSKTRFHTSTLFEWRLLNIALQSVTPFKKC